MLYPLIKNKSNLFKLAENMYKQKKVAVCKFNPNGTFTGRGFIYVVAEMKADKLQYALVCAYARIKKANHLEFLDGQTAIVKTEKVEMIEM